MPNSFFTRSVLGLSGLVGLAVGAGIFFAPVAFHATSGIDLGGDVNLTNEMRAAGGPVLAGSLFVLAGAIWRRFALSALALATALYLSYGTGRLFSMVVDGMPKRELVQVAALEWAIGAACGLALLAQLRRRARTAP